MYSLLSERATHRQATVITCKYHMYGHAYIHTHVRSFPNKCTTLGELSAICNIICVCIYTYTYICRQPWLLTGRKNLHTYAYIHAYMHMYRSYRSYIQITSTYIHTYRHTYTHTDHTYIHTYRSYIHTYIHTYKHTYIPVPITVQPSTLAICTAARPTPPVAP